MKNIIITSSIILVFLAALITSCQKQELPEPDMAITESMEPIAAMLHQDTTLPLPKPDLVITKYSSNVTATTTNCGPTLPDVSCYGQHSFTAAVTIKNIGMSFLPAGNIQIKWSIVGGSSQIQTVPNPVIPIGGTMRVSRPYYLGPCDCAPPPVFTITTFRAEVDPNDLIMEKNENNNISPRYVTCNGC